MIFYDISFLYQIFNSQYLHHLFPNYIERYEFPLTRRTPSHRSQTCFFFIFIFFFSFLHDFFHFFMFTFFNQVLCFSTFLNLFFPHFSYFIFFTRCPSQTCLFSSFFMFIFFTRFFVSPHSQTWRSLGPLTPQQSGLSLNPTCHALGPILPILITDSMSSDSGT